MLLIRKPWDSQPQEAVRFNQKWLDRGLLRSWNFAGRLEIATGEALSVSANETPTVGVFGRALETSGTGAIAALQFLSNSSELPRNGCTVIFAAQRITTGTTLQELKPAFSVGTPAATTGELHAFVPYGGDGNVYWRYGNGTGISVAQTVGLEPNIWGFAAGTAKGREIWRNGAKIASDATNIQRAATTAPLISGTFDASVATTPLHKRYALHIFDEQLTDAEIAFLTSPLGLWDVYEPRVIWVPVSAATGGGTSISGTLGTAVASGFTGTVNANRSIVGSLGVAAASGFTGTISTASPTTITGSLGTAVASGFTGGVNANRTVAGALGVAAASGFTGTVSNTNDVTINGALGVAAASGLTGGVAFNRFIAGLLGTAAASGFTGTVANSGATVGRPTSDASNSGWTPSTGSDLYAMLDEVTPDSADYIVTTATGSICELALNATTYPGTSAQKLSFRGSSSTGNSVIVRLKNTGGATVRSETQLLTGTDALYEITLTAPEIAAITSGALSVELESA